MKISKWILAFWLVASAWTAALPPKADPHTAGKPSAARSEAMAPHKRAEGKVSEEAARKHKSSRKDGRDPFVSPIVEHQIGPRCTGTGRQCLFVGSISLRGIVHYSSGYIAVVMNGDHTYFLRDNDPLADGEVERITGNEIILRQRSIDILGRTRVQDVTKKLGTPAV